MRIVVENGVSEEESEKKLCLKLFFCESDCPVFGRAVKCGGVRPQLMPCASYAEQWGTFTTKKWKI